MSIDLSRLPAPEILMQISPEAETARLTSELLELWPEASELSDADPATKQLQLTAYLATLLRQQFNDGGLGLMLAKASGTTLDGLVANFNVVRAVIDPGDPNAIPPRSPIYESDDRLRSRAQQAWEGLSVAGPAGAYRFHAMSASPEVADVDVTSPAPGQVRIYVLSTAADGVPSPALLTKVTAAVNGDTVRPLTDQVEVVAGTRVTYAVSARLDIYTGPDRTVVLRAATTAVTLYTLRQRRFGELITDDGLKAALRVEGVRQVFLEAPTAAIVPGTGAYPHCTSISVEVA